jgi:hypothetical protein
LRCVEFQAAVSEYVDHSLTHVQALQMDRHGHGCRACARVLAELTLIRNALGNLKECSPRAAYKLRLANCLQLALQDRTRFWARPMALGLAIATALMVILWPHQPQEIEEPVGVGNPHFDLALHSFATPLPSYVEGIGDLPEYSQVQIRTVSY